MANKDFVREAKRRWWSFLRIQSEQRSLPQKSADSDLEKRHPQTVSGWRTKGHLAHGCCSSTFSSQRPRLACKEQNPVHTESGLACQLPDVSPMDYGINGNYKKKLKRRRATARNELVKVAKAVWKEIKILTIQRVISAWPSRVEKVIEAQGFQTEHFSEWIDHPGD